MHKIQANEPAHATYVPHFAVFDIMGEAQKHARDIKILVYLVVSVN